MRYHLSAMSFGRRCHCCEDSCADEIEHFRPKDLYPDWCFCWENYLYSCGPCNGTEKNNKFNVIDANGQLASPPTVGSPARIDPRTEDPLTFMKLDLSGTFRFVAIDDPSNPTQRIRAKYTIETLGLNDREHLIGARTDALEKLGALLFRYISVQQTNPNSPRLKRLAATIRRNDHRTVWEEMKRQRGEIGESGQPFARAPEALDW